MIRKMKEIGKKMVEQGLVYSVFGNLSVRDGKDLIITKTGTFLDSLNDDSFVRVPLSGVSPMDAEASSELKAHREIYRAVNTGAIVHGHPVYSIVLSMNMNSITPADSEGLLFLGEVPAVDGKTGTQELADNLAEALKGHKAVIARGHGVFSIGHDMDEAFSTLCMVEHSARVMYLDRLYKTSGSSPPAKLI